MTVDTRRRSYARKQAYGKTFTTATEKKRRREVMNQRSGTKSDSWRAQYQLRLIMDVVIDYDDWYRNEELPVIMLNITNANGTTFTVPIPFRRSSAQTTWDDATWILTSSFIIFTMQSGFGLLESGACSRRNEVNVMVKNVVDIVFGGITYWMFGYGLSFGEQAGSNAFFGVGYFFVDADEEHMGERYAHFVFQLSFATTATTIVSGVMAERTKLPAYMLFSFLNTIVYSLPASWIWREAGFLVQLGAVDIAGSSVVHIVGGVAGLVGTLMLKPRMGRYAAGSAALPMGSPTNALVGLFMLWWGWLGFNCGSTYGITGHKWKLTAKSAITTINASIGGGITGCFISYLTRDWKLNVADLINSILGALVAVTAGCAVVRPWEALVIGAIGAIITLATVPLLDRLRIDDPVGAVSVHAAAGIWGMLSVGIFAENDKLQYLTYGRAGLIHGGGGYLLGAQTAAVVAMIAWSALTSFMLLLVSLRLSPEDELLGADIAEHCIQYENHTIPPSVMGVHDECPSPVSAIIHSVAAQEDKKNNSPIEGDGGSGKMQISSLSVAGRRNAW
ncbi:PREDICTED: putative ammonium transporter 3 [Priapulus caudatus]|uniref:Ammonium transporter n=1 Tax=Priapulus caudatus TaxID=37621 RepID=A0ABM1ELZ4_PRICU|nr:PREDICTED: putative ammonium transporter 3 [Priapulus caudatus]